MALVEKYYQDPDFTNKKLSKSLSMSERQLHRKCNEYMGKKPASIVREFRLNEAEQLILNGEPVGSVGWEVGFSSASSFARAFKLRFGYAPTEYFQRIEKLTPSKNNLSQNG